MVGLAETKAMVFSVYQKIRRLGVSLLPPPSHGQGQGATSPGQTQAQTQGQMQMQMQMGEEETLYEPLCILSPSSLHSSLLFGSSSPFASSPSPSLSSHGASPMVGGSGLEVPTLHCGYMLSACGRLWLLSFSDSRGELLGLSSFPSSPSLSCPGEGTSEEEREREREGVEREVMRRSGEEVERVGGEVEGWRLVVCKMGPLSPLDRLLWDRLLLPSDPTKVEKERERFREVMVMEVRVDRDFDLFPLPFSRSSPSSLPSSSVRFFHNPSDPSNPSVPPQGQGQRCTGGPVPFPALALLVSRPLPSRRPSVLQV